MSEEILLPFPVPESTLGLAVEIRSTLIASSIDSLRRRGCFDRYEKLLPDDQRNVLLTSVAGLWLPMPTAMAHYQTCEALGFTLEEQLEIGAEVSHKIHDTFLGVVIKMAKNAGVTPWTLLPKGNQLFARLFRGGGGLQIVQVGPKEAQVTIAGLTLFQIPYFRTAIRGIYHSAISLFCTRAYVNEIPRRSTPSSVVLRVAWA